MKAIFTLFLILLSSVSRAEHNMIASAYQTFQQTVQAVGKRDRECRESAIVLPSDIFASLNMTKKVQIIALRYFHFKAHYECMQQAIKDHLLASAVLAAVSESERQKRLLRDSDAFTIESRLHMLAVESHYQQIDDSLQASLDKISALHKPFQLKQSEIALGLQPAR